MTHFITSKNLQMEEGGCTGEVCLWGVKHHFEDALSTDPHLVEYDSRAVWSSQGILFVFERIYLPYASVLRIPHGLRRILLTLGKVPPSSWCEQLSVCGSGRVYGIPCLERTGVGGKNTRFLKAKLKKASDCTLPLQS
ncbi:hypothetical protein RRG08_048457 [Elysia crispata]|uniref:Uncharacterized protein n=1 Tax=Elysia crispata TaxID=231223 RepID=A0AAE1ECP5_9GAST|nr:hypothetical protein RRG08_048457 [Elysia crispata]